MKLSKRLWITSFTIIVVLSNGAIIGHYAFHSAFFTTLCLVNAIWVSTALGFSLFLDYVDYEGEYERR